jgi:hypothetical protein
MSPPNVSRGTPVRRQEGRAAERVRLLARATGGPLRALRRQGRTVAGELRGLPAWTRRAAETETRRAGAGGDDMSDKEQSEFGRGLLTCLLSFFDHKSMIQGHFYAGLEERHGGQRWANGASDHLFELEIPEALNGTSLGHSITVFRDRWVELGHGFGTMSEKGADKAEVCRGLDECKILALAIAVELDKALGLPSAEMGQWT